MILERFVVPAKPVKVGDAFLEGEGLKLYVSRPGLNLTLEQICKKSTLCEIVFNCNQESLARNFYRFLLKRKIRFYVGVNENSKSFLFGSDELKLGDAIHAIEKNKSQVH